MDITNRFPFTPFPDGIFAVAFAHELKPNTIIPITFMGEQLVLFRSSNDDIGALESYCPHLGANLAYGCVKNNTLQCPFHGLRFNKEGACLAKNHLGIAGTYQLKHWRVFEIYGLIFLTHNPLAREMQINFPDLDLSGWGAPIQHCFNIKSHPQEILENSVDRLHFFQVHQYLNIKITAPLQVIGAEFTINYQLERQNGLFGSWERKPLQIQLDIHAYGLGMSKVDIYLPKYRLRARQIVFPTPIDGEYIHIRTLTSISAPKILANLLTRIAAKGFLADFFPDLSIWENKKYVEQPDYLAGDGDFAQYRQWAMQFYRLNVNSVPDVMLYNVPA